MNPHLKEALMMKLQELGNGQFLSDSIPWSTYEMIVEQGLSVMVSIDLFWSDSILWSTST